MEIKQVILVRQDLKMPKGKMSTQCSHASVDAVLKSKEEKVEEWKAQGMKKVVLTLIRYPTPEELLLWYLSKNSSGFKVKTVVSVEESSVGL